MTIKIAHFADTHLGYRQYGLLEREEDYYTAFNNIINDMVENKVDYVLHAGDLFESPKPPINALLVAQKGFEKLLENDIQVYVISGNHDIMQRRNTAIPQELYKNENFHIINNKNNSIQLTGDIFLTGLQYASKHVEDHVAGLLKETTEKSKGYKWKILMLHGAIRKYFEFEPEFELDTIPDGYDYYAMGHLHGRIKENFKSGILSYPGSTEIRSKDELINYRKYGKGYNLVTIADENLDVEYVNMPLLREFIIKTINYPELDESLDKLKEKIVETIDETNKKPVVYLTIQNGNFDRSDVAARIYEKLEDDALTLRVTYEPTETIDDLPDMNEDNLTPEYMIKEKLTEKFNEDLSTLGLELYKSLSVENLSGARKTATEYYEKLYHEDE